MIRATGVVASLTFHHDVVAELSQLDTGIGEERAKAALKVAEVSQYPDFEGINLILSRLLAELHHSRTARVRVAGGGAGGDAPDAPASALGLPYGQPQPPKPLSRSWDTTNHGGVQ